MLCAALLRSFRGQRSEKMKGSAWGNWDPWEGQQPFRPNPNGVGDRTTTLRQLLIGAVFFFCFFFHYQFFSVRQYHERTHFRAFQTNIVDLFFRDQYLHLQMDAGDINFTLVAYLALSKTRNLKYPQTGETKTRQRSSALVR